MAKQTSLSVLRLLGRFKTPRSRHSDTRSHSATRAVFPICGHLSIFEKKKWSRPMFYSSFNRVSTSMTMLEHSETGEVRALFGVYKGQIWYKEKGSERICLERSHCGEKDMSTSFLVLVGEDIYAFSGLLKTNTGLRVWRNGKPLQVTGSNVRGFGAVVVHHKRCEEDPSKTTFLLASGLGVGRSSVFSLIVDGDSATCEKVGSVSACSGRSFTSLAFDCEATRLVGLSGTWRTLHLSALLFLEDTTLSLLSLQSPLVYLEESGSSSL